METQAWPGWEGKAEAGAGGLTPEGQGPGQEAGRAQDWASLGLLASSPPQ